MEVTSSAFVKLFKPGILLHVVFLGSLFLITAAITLQSPSYAQVAPRALLVYFLLVGCFYTGRWLTQKFLMKKRWGYLLSLFCISVTAFSLTGIFAMAYLMGIKDGSDLSAIVVPVPLFIMLSIFAGGFIAITRIVIRQQIKEISILQHQSKAELNLLTSKLSPHFLFNTLNNLYGLARNNHAKVPDLLLKLSDLLSYTLYSSDKPFVSLKEELAYIQDFSELEKIRISDRLELKIEIAAFEETIRIVPMVLIVFVENAFKHAKNTKTNKIQIYMKLWTTNQFIYFEIENSKGEIMGISEEQNAGLGLVTTRKRLDLLYGRNYSLVHGEKRKNYFVNLKIPKNATD
jgi:two-component system, LytTR family, sensor kinase